MDTILEKKKGLRKKHIPYIVVGVATILVSGRLIFGSHASKMNVDKDKLIIQSVISGEFNDYIRISGQVQPIATIQLSAVEGGMVAEKLVEEGSFVKEGEPIVRLSNNMLNLNILDSEAQLAEKQNWLRNTRVQMEQEKLTLRQNRLRLALDVEQKKRKAEQYEKLFDEKLCSKEEFLQAKEDYQFAVDGLKLVDERQIQDSLYRGIQVSQMEESLGNIRKNLELVRSRVDNLIVRASVSGQLGLLDVEIGQSVPTGGKIGQISVLSDYKVEALIDEHYIDKVGQGLEATFERQDKNFALRVRKVFPEVRNKQFKTEFVFEGERPDNIRAGQTYYISLQLGQPAQSLMIPRGAFYQTTGGRWIYAVTPDGRKAVRRDVAIGRQNPTYYEIVSGLDAGERVVTSAYNFGDAQELILK